MDKPFPAYRDDAPYVFVCYAHEDEDVVYPEIGSLHEQGINLWYDEGISAGKVWRAEIAEAIQSCSKFLYYISAASLSSEHCNREVGYALDRGFEIVPVYLEDIDLTPELDLALNRVHALHRDEDASYRQHLLNALRQTSEAAQQSPRQKPKSPSTDTEATRPAVEERNGTVPILAGMTGVVVLAIGLLFYSQQGDEIPIRTQPERSSIAVLPFVNMSSDKEQEYFSDGISEEILNVLSQIPRLHVTSRSSSFSFKGEKIDLTEVADKLGVENILEGSVRKSGNRLRITAQLIAATSDKQLWSETFERELTVDNVFDIQNEIANAIVVALKDELGLDVKLASREIRDVSLDAHSEYLKGRFFLLRQTEEDAETALRHFSKATELAPDYAPGWSGLAWAHASLSERFFGSVPREVSYERATQALQRALQLDPELPEAYVTLGQIEFRSDKAVPAFEKAIELNPNYAPAYAWLSSSLSGPDTSKRRLSLSEKAVKLDPMALLLNAAYSRALVDFGRFEEAEQVIQHMKKIEPNSNSVTSAYYYLRQQQRRYGEATYYALKRNQYNSNLQTMFNLAENYNRLGLNQLTADVFEGGRWEFIGRSYTNWELSTSEARATVPRSDADVSGAWFRAYGEYADEKYTDAVQYVLLSSFLCTDCNELIFSYLRLGDIESARPLLEQRRRWHQARVSAGMVSKISAMHLALLDSDVPKAMGYLKLAADEGLILGRMYRNISPLYGPLREHPDWPALLAESERRATKQREIYLKLVAEDNETVH